MAKCVQRIPHEGEIYQAITASSQNERWRVGCWGLSTATIEAHGAARIKDPLSGDGDDPIGAAMAWLLAHQDRHDRFGPGPRCPGARMPARWSRRPDYRRDRIGPCRRRPNRPRREAGRSRKKAEDPFPLMPLEGRPPFKEPATVGLPIAKAGLPAISNIFDRLPGTVSRSGSRDLRAPPTCHRKAAGGCGDLGVLARADRTVPGPMTRP